MRKLITSSFCLLLGCYPQTTYQQTGPAETLSISATKTTGASIPTKEPFVAPVLVATKQAGLPLPATLTLTITDSTCSCWTTGQSQPFVNTGAYWTCTFGPQKSCTSVTEFRMIALQPGDISVARPDDGKILIAPQAFALSVYCDGVRVASSTQRLPMSTKNPVHYVFMNLIAPQGYTSCGSLSDTINVLITP